MTTSTSVSARGERQRLDLAGAEERRRIGLRPLLQHAQHDLGAGRLGEAGQLVERSLRLETPRAAGDQPDQRRRSPLDVAALDRRGSDATRRALCSHA